MNHYVETTFEAKDIRPGDICMLGGTWHTVSEVDIEGTAVLLHVDGHGYWYYGAEAWKLVRRPQSVPFGVAV